jgi:SAM-dependent methyltransferase
MPEPHPDRQRDRQPQPEPAAGPEPEHGHQHGHGHGHGFDDWDAQAEELEREGEIGLPWFEAAADWLAELTTAAGGDVRRVLDVGSGPGVATGVLAVRFPAARVTAVDSAPELLARAGARAERLGVGDRVDLLSASLDGDLAELPEADLIWASRVVHHLPDQAGALRALAGRLRPPGAAPGGLLALAEGGLASRFLPNECGIGAPGLLERLDAAVAEGLTTLLGHGADSPVPRPVLDWPAQLAEAGLTPTGSRSFLLDLPAPVTPAVREHLIRRVARTPSLASDHLRAGDRAALEQLLDPGHPLGLHRRPDLFLLTAVTVHTARRI